MASVASKTWTDEEVGLLLHVFAEETIQIGLEKAKCPKDKNAVYLEVQKKLEQHGKFYILKSFLLTVFISSLSFRSDATSFFWLFHKGIMKTVAAITDKLKKLLAKYKILKDSKRRAGIGDPGSPGSSWKKWKWFLKITQPLTHRICVIATVKSTMEVL